MRVVLIVVDVHNNEGELESIVCEGIAGLRVARLQTFSEPRHALLRGAVRPAFRLNRTTRHFLEPVVSDG